MTSGKKSCRYCGRKYDRRGLAAHERACAKTPKREWWEARYGEPYPESREALLRLGARSGISGETLLAGKWTPADILPLIEGYLLRRADQAKMFALYTRRTRT